MAFHEFDPNEDDDQRGEKTRDFLGPSQIDHQIRMAIQLLWTVLPKEKRNVDEVERQIRRIVDRAMRDLRDDFENFFGTKGR